MLVFLADARFAWSRAINLVRRAAGSLRTRGWRSTLARICVHMRPPPATQRPWLLFPETAPFAPFDVSTSASPSASIVIPVYNQFARTLACLRALAAYPPACQFEVIVVDDGSSDQTSVAMPQIGGVRYHQRAENGGFIVACNDGAALAQGATLVFLNNDTVPQPGWLDAMLATLDIQKDAGIVGAKLLYPDGRLQEAGGVLFRDGTAWSYGRFEASLDPRYAYLREADYVSGAALAIPASLFRSVGGFSMRYAPAYYEDTDLAFAVRATGRRVIYQPSAVVVHDEGATAGTDPSTGMKAYQAINRTQFAERWKDALASHLAPDSVPVPALLHRHQRQVLIIDALTPQPDRDSGSLRLFNLIRLLRQDGAHVVFLPANLAFDGRYTEALQQLGVEAWYAPFVTSAPAWLREHGHRFDVALVSRHYVASEFLSLLRRHAPQASILFDSVDLHYLRERRAADMTNSPAARRAADRTRMRELRIVSKADVTLVVSEYERTILAADAPRARVELLSNVHEIAGCGRSFAERRDIVFVGGFRHPPNVDAVLWFVAEVWPKIAARLPDAVFHCIGGDLPPEIEALASVPGVRVHGYVPDIRPYMDGALIAVAPLRYGAGVKGKVNLSMAHGQPVVATSCAVEGMHLRNGEDVLIADDASAFAEAVIRIHNDEALWHRLSQGGLANVSRHFSVDVARDTARRLFLTDTGAQ